MTVPKMFVIGDKCGNIFKFFLINVVFEIFNYKLSTKTRKLSIIIKCQLSLWINILKNFLKISILTIAWLNSYVCLDNIMTMY